MSGANFRKVPRVCTKCLKHKPATEFNGTRLRCKGCEYNWRRSPEERARQQRQDRKPRNRYSNSRSQCLHTRFKWRISFEDWYALVQKPCFYCGGKLGETGKGLDRLDNEGHYEVGNVVPCCHECNHTRSRHLLVDEMREIFGPAMALARKRREVRGLPPISVYKAVHEKAPTVDLSSEPAPLPGEIDMSQMTIFEVIK